MKKILFAFLILTSCYATGADVDNALLQKNLEAANTQIEILKAQIDVMKNYQDKILTTVWGALGVVSILIGYNWFVNKISQERELQTLKLRIDSEISTAKKDLLNEMDDSKKVILDNIHSKITEEINNKTKSILSKINYLSREINDQSYSLLKLDYEKWLLTEKVYGNAVTTAVEMINLSQHMKYEYGVEESLEKLIFVLEQGLREKKKYTIDVNATKAISEVLSKLSDHYESSKLKIQELITRLNNLD